MVGSIKREARIILPDNAGLEARNAVVDAILQRFHGFTAFKINGAWKASDGGVMLESGTAYDIACPDNADSGVKLHQIAVTALRHSEEKCIYLRYPNGTVDFVI